ncbi:MAG: hypothetical protein ABIQ95_04155 [Bdellovibrionia bacterium]
MLKGIGYLIRLALFSVFILVLGNSVHWEGKTISDQVKLRMSHAERSEVYGSVRSWAEKLTLDATRNAIKRVDRVTVEEIRPSERQKLKALIRELNNSHN